MDIKKINIPEAPGVYIFKDKKGDDLYIGKARSLKKRVTSHFQRPASAKAGLMLSQVNQVDFIPTTTEYQALLLEAQLIKERQPYYNVELRDDKSFPWIKISRDRFPIVSLARPRRKTNADYFGPYTNARLLRQALKEIRKLFPYCTCKNKPKKPCLYCRINLCPAPYAGKISRKEYLSNIHHIKLFIQGRHKHLLNALTDKMKRLAKEKKFEQACVIRDKIRALGSLLQNTEYPYFGKIDRLKDLDELTQLKHLLNLSVLPHRIEAFDISNITGKQPCGSMVSFLDGRADKNNYRRFKIKTVSGIDDYRMLAEVVRRRYNRVIRENLPMPGLIIIDGGKGHLAVAEKEIKNLGLNIPIISIAKEHEEIFTLTSEKPLRLKSDSKVLQLIQRIRNEAHRFAIKYHKFLRKKKMFNYRCRRMKSTDVTDKLIRLNP